MTFFNSSETVEHTLYFLVQCLLIEIIKDDLIAKIAYPNLFFKFYSVKNVELHIL